MTDCKPFLLIWFCQALVLATWKATKRHTELSLGIETYLPEPKGKLQHLPSVLTSGDVNHRRAQGGQRAGNGPQEGLGAACSSTLAVGTKHHGGGGGGGVLGLGKRTLFSYSPGSWKFKSRC